MRSIGLQHEVAPRAGSRRRWLRALVLACWVLGCGALLVDGTGPCGLSAAGMTVLTSPGRALALVYDPCPAQAVALGPTLAGAPLSAAALPGGWELVECRLGEAAAPAQRVEHQPASDPRLRALRDRAGLEGRVAAAQSDLAAAEAVTAWAREGWEFGTPARSLCAADALAVLEAVAQGERLHCAHAAYLALEGLLALGFSARVLRLEGGAGVHAVVEAWCDDLGRWVVLDPTEGLRYERAGRPLSGAELGQAWRTGTLDGIEQVSRSGRAVAGREELERFGRVRVCLRTDLLSRRCPRWHPRYFGNVWQGLWAELEADWTPNQVALSLAGPPGRHEVRLRLATYTPNFAGFEAREDGGDWRPVSSELLWRLRPGENRLEVRARNQLGRAGRPSRLILRLPAGDASAPAGASR